MPVNTLVVMEIFYLFFMRNAYGTSLTRKAVAGTPAVWLPGRDRGHRPVRRDLRAPLQQALGTRAVPLADGLVFVGIGVVLFALIETEKQMRLRLAAMRRGMARGAPPFP